MSISSSSANFGKPVTSTRNSWPSKSTLAHLPPISSPATIFAATAPTTCRSSQRPIGRAPSSGSKASDNAYSTAASVAVSSISNSARRLDTSCNCRRTTLRRTDGMSGLNTTTSSKRLRSSGRSELRAVARHCRLAGSRPRPSSRAAARTGARPKFEVMMKIALEASTVLPYESVSLPLSSASISTSTTSGCAFSRSSKRTTECGLNRKASVSWPCSSCPDKVGRAPRSLASERLSANSPRSIWTTLNSLQKSEEAIALVISVLPVPEGPRKRKEPRGRMRFFRPAALIRTVLATASAASSWPKTLALSVGPRLSKRSRSVRESRCTGMQVHRATTPAMSSMVTTSFRSDTTWPLSASKRCTRFFHVGISLC
mmetsp:Transcript_43852/g.115720  ORF Transcript_43852/g.115720 Transcript_43852/m.115720 type:complete len:372 (+) Transcript_43852:197-1312(+)